MSREVMGETKSLKILLKCKPNIALNSLQRSKPSPSPPHSFLSILYMSSCGICTKIKSVNLAENGVGTRAIEQ
jgi:hypothetical protein